MLKSVITRSAVPALSILTFCHHVLAVSMACCPKESVSGENFGGEAE
jgi:hypothetical protein